MEFWKSLTGGKKQYIEKDIESSSSYSTSSGENEGESEKHSNYSKRSTFSKESSSNTMIPAEVEVEVEEEQIFRSSDVESAFTTTISGSTNHDIGNNDGVEASESHIKESPVWSRTSRFKFGNIEEIDVIERSPYEPNRSAEVGEPIFQKLKYLLLSNEELEGEVQDLDGIPTLTIQDATKELFGSSLADAFVKAYYVIGRSGVLFNSSWLDNKECKIGNLKCGWIPKHMMLLVLHEQRFGRANDANLQSVVNTLGVNSIFFDALEEWGFHDAEFWHNTPSLQFSSKKNHCLKCVIFIARVFRCIKVLRRQQERNEWDFQEHERSLYVKVKQCLAILKQHIKVNPKKLAQYKAQQEQPDDSLNLKEHKRVLENVARADNKRRKCLDKGQNSKLRIAKQPQTPASQAQGDALTRRVVLPEVKVLSSSVADIEQEFSTHDLLKLAEIKFKQLGRIIKKLRRKVEEDKEILKEELRRQIRHEIEEEGNRLPGSTRLGDALLEK